MKTATTGTQPFHRAACRAIGSTVVMAAALLAGCGGGGGDASPAAVNTTPSSQNATPLDTVAGGSFTFTSDSYGMANPTYLSATTSGSELVLRAAVASGMTDPDYRTVLRIDVADPGAVAAGKRYSLGGSSSTFPGAIYIFNGHNSTLLETTSGTISFTSYGTSPGAAIAGSFNVVITDGGDPSRAGYAIAGDFAFTAAAAGEILPAPVPVPPSAASIYSTNCACCHSLGALDGSPGAGPDLALKGGGLDAFFRAGHQGITLGGPELTALKVLLNVN